MRTLMLMPVLSLSGCALFTLAATKRSHPTLEGAIAGVEAESTVRIRRDAQGIPHIEAESSDDAWYGLGFVHAQDRLFQADLGRRVAHGRLSELLGERALDLDTFLGAMELERLGQQALDASTPESQARVAAYVRGLNAGAASLKTLPVEYRLLKVELEPFRPVDTTGMLFLMGWSLQENLDHELASLDFAHLPSDELGALFQTSPDTPPIDAFWEDVRTLDTGELTEGFKAFTATLGGRPEGNAEASNNWAISGARTASGKPIVANDPHLVQSVPSLWYAADVHGGDMHVAGVTLPGVPGFPIGHNERVAWGLTNVMADTVDLALLERSGDDVIVRGVAESPVPRTVTLKPKGSDPVERTVLYTSLGPIINTGGEVAVVLRWAGLETDDHSPDLFGALIRATDVPSLTLTHGELASVAPQNVVMGDVDGNIGFRVSGSIPRRHGYTGRVPYPASSGELHWDGFLDDLPEVHNPDDGIIVTANSKPDHANADAIATAYLPPHRLRRIEERLTALDQATPADMSAIHLDHRDNAAALYLPELLEGVTASGPGECLALLQGWDFEASVDAVEPTVFGAFQEELFRLALDSRLDEQQLSVWLDLMSTGRSPMDGDLARFLDHRESQVATALTRGCERLHAELGGPENWAWGPRHPLKLQHPFGAQSKLLKGWNMEEVPYPGTGASVSAADFDWTADEWKVGFMASMRIVMPLDDLGASTFVMPGGQGGQPKSPYYRSHYDAFVAGDTLPLWFDLDDVKAHTVHELVLTP